MAKKETAEGLDINALVADLNKELKINDVYVLDSNKVADIERLSSGSLTYDICTGGGYPKGRHTSLYGAESSGKAQPLSSKILTPFGWKTMGDMEVGSIISTPDGKDTTILGVFPQGVQDVYEITFDDKTKTRCTLDHLWFVNTRGTDIGEVLTTENLLEKGLKNKRGVRKFYIPMSKPIEFEKNNLPINPYLLGILIGDGGLTSNIKFTTVDEEILLNIRNIVKKDFNNLKVSKQGSSINYSISKILNNSNSENELTKIIKDLNLFGKYSYEKHIPEIYLRASIEDRIELLRGLMDSDGSVEQGLLSFSTSSLQLSKDFEDLCRGLGARCNTSSRATKYTSNTGNKVDGRLSYRSSILLNTFNFNPFHLERKKSLFNYEKVSTYSNRFIESIERVGEEECQCIAIGHPDKLYITDDYIVTHNTTNAIMALKQYQESGDPRVALVLDAEFAFDKNYAKNLGVDLSRVIFRQPEEVTEAHDVLMYLLKKDAIGFFIVDSIAALQPRSVIENEADASNIGKHANAIGNMFKSANSYVGKQKVVGVWINQIRDKIGSFTGGVSEPAGHVPKFYSSIRIQVFRGSKEDNGDGTFKNKGKITVNKNKTASPYQSGEYSMSHGLGIDVSEEVLDYGVKCNVLYKKGHSFYYDETFENNADKNKDHIFLGKSKGDSKQFLDDNLELRKVLYDKILETYLNK